MTEIASIGLFGGSFDPPHTAHLALLEELQQDIAFDEIRLIPCGQHALNKEFSVAAIDRQQMLRRAIANRSYLTIDGVEIDSQETSYTLNTCKKIRHELTASTSGSGFAPKSVQYRLTLIVGSDILAQLHRWYCWEELLEWVNLAIVYRPRTKEQQNRTVFLEELLALESAASDVRKHLMAREYEFSRGKAAEMPLRGAVTSHCLSSWLLSSTRVRHEIARYWQNAENSSDAAVKEREPWLIDAVGPEVWEYIKTKNLYKLRV